MSYVFPKIESAYVMAGFAKLLGFVIVAAIVCAALTGVFFLINVVIAFWPIIVGFGVLLFILYIFFVGLCHLGDDDKK